MVCSFTEFVKYGIIWYSLAAEDLLSDMKKKLIGINLLCLKGRDWGLLGNGFRFTFITVCEDLV